MWLLLLAALWFNTDNAGWTYCENQVAPGVYDHCTLLVSNTNDTWISWTGNTWAGNPFCEQTGTLLQPTSPAIDMGVVTEIHCTHAGPCTDQPGKNEWYGAAPDAGACEFIPTTKPPTPSGLNVQTN